MTAKARLRPLGEADLDMLLQWRNSEQVRRFMYSTDHIGREEHRRWYAAICNDAKRHPLIFELYGSPSGFVNFGPVRPGKIADWGFYVAPGSPQGTGGILGNAALAFAFSQLRLHKVCGEALGFNEASRRFHLRQGFRQEGVLVDQHFDGTAYHDVIQFGLRALEWWAITSENGHEEES